ncbi:MAG: hypothetical protein AB7T22_02435 [Calditrichaceae bacterium]
MMIKFKIALFFGLFTILPAPGTAQENPVHIPFKPSLSSIRNDANTSGFAEMPVTDRLVQENDGLLDAPQKKSVGKALFLSLLLPGSGEYYTGHGNSAKFFLGVELLAWGGWLANTLHVNRLEDAYTAYASQHAGVNKNGKDDQYWIDIGKYDNIYDFNEQRRRDRDIDAIYTENDLNYWEWDSGDNRLVFDGKRIRASEIANQDIYYVAAIVLNHMVSGINAMRLARKHNRNIAEQTSWNVRFTSHSYAGNDRFIGFQISTRF